MKDFFQFAPIGLAIWWLAQTLLSLRDYFVRRGAVRRMPPPSEEEKAALARLRAELPQKEKRSLRWHIEHPHEALKGAWFLLPVYVLVLVFFWPMAVLLFTLPRGEPRLSQDLIQRLNADSA